MAFRSLTLLTLDGAFAVCRLGSDATVPSWATSGSFFSITRSPDELSVLCSENAVPSHVKAERGWRCLRVGGVIPFSDVGVIASLAAPLAEAEISTFTISTFDTDYLLVKESDFKKAHAVLQSAGHRFCSSLTS